MAVAKGRLVAHSEGVDTDLEDSHDCGRRTAGERRDRRRQRILVQRGDDDTSRRTKRSNGMGRETNQTPRERRTTPRKTSDKRTREENNDRAGRNAKLGKNVQEATETGGTRHKGKNTR